MGSFFMAKACFSCLRSCRGASRPAPVRLRWLVRRRPGENSPYAARRSRVPPHVAVRRGRAELERKSPPRLASAAPAVVCNRRVTQISTLTTKGVKAFLELELELIQTEMAQKPVLRVEVRTLFCVLTRAQRTRVHFCPQHWLLCRLGLYSFGVWCVVRGNS
jgi:hypothetical protein